MFAYFTLVCYLVVGSIAVRFISTEFTTISFTTAYTKLLESPVLETSEEIAVSVPEMSFENIRIPVEKKIIARAPKAQKILKDVPELEVKVVSKIELPFYEPVVLKPVSMKANLPANLLASYQDFKYEETVVAQDEVIKDEVQTSLAAAETVEPEFFEYPVKEEEKLPAVEKTTEKTEAVVAEIEETQVSSPATENVERSEGLTQVSSDYSDVKPKIYEPQKTVEAEEVAVNDLITFDYSSQSTQANTSTQTVSPVKVAVTTHKKAKPVNPATQSEEITQNGFVESTQASALHAPETYEASLAIQAVGTSLKRQQELKGFEVRYQDDLAEAQEDYGTGTINLEANLSQPKMTRSITLLKRGYIPTSTEIILEEGHGSVAVPMIEEEVLNDLLAPYDRRLAVGAVLVELDDDTELAQLDVKFEDVITLNGDMKITKSENFRYQLFVGVQAGNALLTYKRRTGDVLQKILHVHEHELTFDANYYEDVVNEKVKLYEEDLLAKESSALVISGDQVKVFATNKVAKKINDQTYKLDFGVTHLGGRRYLELNHQEEPIFVGIRDNNNVTVPSENFMRFILSKVEGARLGNRCLVQVNLGKKIEKFEIGSESVGASLTTHAQVLDSDGKFYDSVSEKTQKLIVIGESQAASDVSADAKINIKIQFQDGSVQFLNSYCSPNTYLVEQL
jgi:hypothetical protein